MDSLFSIKEVLENYIKGCRGKIESSPKVTFGKAVLAGAMIAMGAGASNVASHSITNVGLSRLAAAVVFPVGLMMVVLLGAELFTGDCLATISVFDKKQKLIDLIKFLFYVYLGNFVGAVIIAVLTYFSGQLDYSSGLLGAYTIKIALGKVNISFAQGISSGILCNILVCAAVFMASCAKDVTGKLLACFFTIMLFVTAGFEHCVANMYYIVAGIFALGNESYAALAADVYGFTAEQLSSLNVVSFLKDNLLPVTIGNILGGVLFTGAPIYYLNKTKKKSNTK